MVCSGDLDSAALHPGYDKRLGRMLAQSLVFEIVQPNGA
jgi:hypothetical protein